MSVDAAQAVRKLATPTGLSAREKDDDYRSVVAVLSDDWRVIECRDGLQWIIQRRDKPSEKLATIRWRNMKHHRHLETLLVALAELKIDVSADAMAALRALPRRIDLRGNQ